MKRRDIVIVSALGLAATFVSGGCVASDGDVGYYGEVGYYDPGWYGRPGYGRDTVVVQPGFDHRQGGDDHRDHGPAPAAHPAPRGDDHRMPGIPNAPRPSAPRGGGGGGGKDRR